ncbi:MAG: endonuclease V [Candidatus Hermodarchaeota archaeon]
MQIIEELLNDDYSIEQAEELQIKYQNLLNHLPENKFELNLKAIKNIVGLDISYFKKESKEYGVACAVVWNFKQKMMESYYLTKGFIKFPYKPGFLGFRECKLLATVISRLPNKPDLIICDGHGKIHPKKFGEAVHLGLALDIPSIGVAKNPFCGYYNSQKIQYIKGDKTPIWEVDPKLNVEAISNELLGYAICLNNNLKPVFISVGYKISLDTAINVCLELTNKHRLPEPLFLADKLSRKEVINYH